MSAPGEATPPAAEPGEAGSASDGYFGKAILTFRDRDGLRWTAGALVAPLSCEGLEGELPFTHQVAEERGLVATGLTVVYDDE